MLEKSLEKPCTPLKSTNQQFDDQTIKTPAQLAADNQRLVYREAQKLLRRGLIHEWDKEEYRDVVAAGMVGLAQAARKFDPTTGNRFSSLACVWIRGEMLHYLRDRGVGLKVSSAWKGYYSKGYGLSDTEAAAKCSITLELWLEVKEACSLWVKEWDTKYDRAEEPSSFEPEETPHLDKARDAIAIWLNALTEADRAIVEAVYFEGKSRKKDKRRLVAILSNLI